MLGVNAGDANASPESSPEEDAAVRAIRVYQGYLSSLRHVRCRFTPSCSEYAAQAIATFGLAEGSARAADRLMRCNASANAAHPRNDKGVLLDPVVPLATEAGGVRVPAWLLPPPAPDAPPLGSSRSIENRSSWNDPLRFAQELEWRGDCDRSATEYQRVASLVGGSAAEAWAFTRIGDCQFSSSRWTDAETAFLTCSMLASEGGTSANATWMAAASRFNSGAYEACERLVSDSTLSPARPLSMPQGESLAVASARAPGPHAYRIPALIGLSRLARGDWSGAEVSLRRSAEIAPTTEARDRLTHLSEAAPGGESLPHRSRDLATALSVVVPGTGQMYAGRWSDGTRTLIFNAMLILTVVSFARGEHVPAAVLTASIAVPFYVGNVLGARSAARRFDRRERERFVEQAIVNSSR
jgi:putative membrane protein insertion efficiency factor